MANQNQTDRLQVGVATAASATQQGLVTTGAQTFAGAKTFNGVISPTAGITGLVATPTTGQIGEIISGAGGTGGGSTTITTSGTTATVVGITLTPGVWDVTGSILMNSGATTAWTMLQAGISTNPSLQDSIAAGGVIRINGLQTLCPVSSALYTPLGTRSFVVTSGTLAVYMVYQITYTTLGGASLNGNTYLQAKRTA